MSRTRFALALRQQAVSCQVAGKAPRVLLPNAAPWLMLRRAQQLQQRKNHLARARGSYYSWLRWRCWARWGQMLWQAASCGNQFSLQAGKRRFQRQAWGQGTLRVVHQASHARHP